MDECRISKKEAATIVDLFFGKISTALADGDRVEIRGLCSFFVKELAQFIFHVHKIYDLHHLHRFRAPPPRNDLIDTFCHTNFPYNGLFDPYSIHFSAENRSR
jgi:hypothetical protein